MEKYDMDGATILPTHYDPYGLQHPGSILGQKLFFLLWLNFVIFLNLCRNLKCQQRHFQICKYFEKDNNCKYQEKCAYFHREENDAQQKLNEILACALATQIKEVADMRNKLNKLKIKVQSLEDFIQVKHINKDSIKQNSTSEEADNV